MSIESVTFEWNDEPLTKGASFRYDLLTRVHKACMGRAKLLAFGVGDSELRLLVQGTPGAIGQAIRGIKVGTIRYAASRDVKLRLSPTFRWATQSIYWGVIWAHRASLVQSPLSSPWTSHRDLMGYRVAPFFDATAIQAQLQPQSVHEELGGTPLPIAWPDKHGVRESLVQLLRIAGGVLGVMPADRRCFALFVKMAKARGWMTTDCARALALTPRRIRQLANVKVKEFKMGMRTLADARLRQVP